MIASQGSIRVHRDVVHTGVPQTRAIIITIKPTTKVDRCRSPFKRMILKLSI